MFLEFSSPLHAQEAVKMTNGYKLDKQHTFAVNLFSDLDRYRNIPDEWEEPEIRPYEDKVFMNFCSLYVLLTFFNQYHYCHFKLCFVFVRKVKKNSIAQNIKLKVGSPTQYFLYIILYNFFNAQNVCSFCYFII